MLTSGHPQLFFKNNNSLNEKRINLIDISARLYQLFDDFPMISITRGCQWCFISNAFMTSAPALINSLTMLKSPLSHAAVSGVLLPSL